ncbi:MAG: glycosyltransferase family 4 protein [Proteobacteria bacterium]|nr:glycosyltransferase family 4 protein [Pseudomonadota bacterium]
MKIGIVTEYFYPTLGGITENVYHFSRELMRLGHDFRIITGREGSPPEVDREIRERVIFVGRSTPVFFNASCGRVSFGTGLARKVRDILERERFDLIHLHSPLFPTLPQIANIQALSPAVGTFHTVLGGTDDIYYKLYRERCLRLLDRMDGRIAVSDCCAAELRGYFGREFDVIPNGVDVEWWAQGRPIERFADGKFNILFIGRPDRRNGLDVLINAFARIHRSNRDTRLIVVGDGPLAFHFHGIVPNDVRDAVLFEGAAHNRRPDYLASAHAFVFTPAIASFGITILEGMSGGRAMVASDIEAFRALVTHGESALLVPPGDEDALAAALERLIADGELRESLGATAALRVERYDWKRIAEMQLEYYKKVIGGQLSVVSDL